MNSIQRKAITTAGLVAAVFAPTMAMAQRGGGGNALRNPIFVVATFKSPGEAKLGVDVADAIRQRMAKIFPQQPLRPGVVRVVTREEVNSRLVASAYPADSAVSTSDLRDLGKGIGADETMEGTATRVAGGVEVRARFYSLSNIIVAEVLPPVVDKDAVSAGRKVAEMYAAARRELADYETCRSAVINKENDRAKTAAKAALLQYKDGVLPRACLMSAYLNEVAGAKTRADSLAKFDSVAVVAGDIVAIDSNNTLALGGLADAYLVRGDTAKSIDLNLKLWRLDPNNSAQAQTIIGILANSGAPDKAIPIVNELLANNSGDSTMLDMKWKLLQAAHQWKQAIAAGEEMIKFSPSMADTTYFSRQIAAAISDSQPALELQFLAKATQKFPSNTHFWLGYSQELRKQGQIQQALDAAKKAVEIDPKIDNGFANVLSLYAVLGQADSALAYGKRALAAGADKPTIGGALATLLTPAYKKASASSARADWEEVFRMASVVDSIAPQPTTAFFMSFSAFNIGQAAVTTIGDLIKVDPKKPADQVKADKAKACDELKIAGDMFLVVDLNMARGGSFNGDVAAQILNGLGTLKPYIDQYKRAIPCR